jgi:hypothetical protein
MNIVFDITEIESFSIKNSSSTNYSLELKLQFGTYLLGTDEGSFSELLKNYFNEKDNFFYSYVNIQSNGNNSIIKFQQYGTELVINMSDEKLLKLYEEMTKDNFKHRFLRVELSEDDMKKFPSREDIEDGIETLIKFEKYSFEFVVS